MPAKTLPGQYAGARFGRLLVLGDAPRDRFGKWRLLVRCDCGVEKVVGLASLKKRWTRSCGCLQRERAGDTHRTHGESKRTAEYRIWQIMHARCNGQVKSSRAHYSERGITVCDRWSSFENFLADMGRRPSQKHTIERKDNDLGYSPENCVWATRLEQMRNTSKNVKLTHGGLTLCVSEWAEKLGFKVGTLAKRIREGWSVERALTTPVRRR